MKWCTRWDVDRSGTPMKVSDVSLVDDDHQFGAGDDGKFHVEAIPSRYSTPQFVNHDLDSPVGAG